MTRTQRIFLWLTGAFVLCVLAAFIYQANTSAGQRAIPLQSSSAAAAQQASTSAPQPAPQQKPLPTLKIGGQTVSVMIAATEAARELGLGGRSGLGSHEGMLFVFPNDGYYSFWMKDMSFSIDMVWLSAQGKVVFIEENVSPDTYPLVYTPTAPARYVVELPAGFTQQYNIRVGDYATLPQL